MLAVADMPREMLLSGVQEKRMSEAKRREETPVETQPEMSTRTTSTIQLDGASPARRSGGTTCRGSCSPRR